MEVAIVTSQTKEVTTGNKDQNSSPLFLKVIINILEGKQTAQPYFPYIYV